MTIRRAEAIAIVVIAITAKERAEPVIAVNVFIEPSEQCHSISHISYCCYIESNDIRVNIVCSPVFT